MSSFVVLLSKLFAEIIEFDSKLQSGTNFDVTSIKLKLSVHTNFVCISLNCIELQNIKFCGYFKIHRENKLLDIKTKKKTKIILKIDLN